MSLNRRAITRIILPFQMAAAVLPLLFFLLYPLHSKAADMEFELTPLITDDASEVILPVALFAEQDGGFIIIDAGSNSGRLKEYSPDGNLIEAALPSFAVEGSTPPGMRSFNPFGSPSWAKGDDGILLLERRPTGAKLRKISKSGDLDSDLPKDLDLRLVLNSARACLFCRDGLANAEGEIILPADLAGFDKICITAMGDILALSASGLSKLNPYGIPQWEINYPVKDKTSFLPISLASTDKEAIIAGVVLPRGLATDEFRDNYESAYSSNPALAPNEIRRLFDYLSTDGIPMLLSYSSLDGQLRNGLELDECPIWVDTDGEGNIYTLSLGADKALVSRIAPDFSSALTLFEMERGQRALEGASKIAVSGGFIYHDKSEEEYTADGGFREKLSILRRPLDNPAIAEEFISKPAFDGGYLVAGLATDDEMVYLAGAAFSISPDDEILPAGAFLDAYSPAGQLKMNFLEGAEPTLIPNCIAIAPDGDIIMAVTHGGGTLSTSWALRFSKEGRLAAEYFHLGPGGINEINMVAGGTIGVALDGAIYQCDNIRHPDPEKAYMRTFDAKGKFTADLRKYCLVNAGLLGFAGGRPVFSWQNRYLLRLEDADTVTQADLGEHFEPAEPLEITSDADNIYLLLSDAVIYKMPLDSGWTSEDYPLGDVLSAAETLRSIILTYTATFGAPPEQIDSEFWKSREGDERTEDLMEHFFGPGPFEYSVSGRDNFRFLLFGRDVYQTIFEVTRDGVEEVF